jgi:hypothetical protein
MEKKLKTFSNFLKIFSCSKFSGSCGAFAGCLPALTDKYELADSKWAKCLKMD